MFVCLFICLFFFQFLVSLFNTDFRTLDSVVCRLNKNKTMKEENNLQKPHANDEIVISPLTYHQKPAIGQDNQEDLSPVQILFPNGGFGIGVALKNPEAENTRRHETHRLGVLASAPSGTELDRAERRGLLIAFQIVGIVNIILTSLLFAYADTADSSKVEPETGYLPSGFERISSERRPIEKINFAFTIILLVLGMVSVFFENALGLTGYCVGIILNFFLANSSLSSFVFSFRYILDIGMLYIGLVIRSRLMYTFLPLNLHRA